MLKEEPENISIGDASIRNTSVPLYVGSYQSSAEVEQPKSVKVEVVFGATLVTVDHGGWFQPQFFEQSAGFHSLDTNISWSNDIGALNPVDAEEANIELNEYLLPAYSTGSVIFKDITIKIHPQATNIDKSASEMETYAATSAGILRFSASSSDSSRSQENEFMFQVVPDGCVIRLPDPQILDYTLHFIDPLPESQTLCPKISLILMVYNSIFASLTRD
ncbi:hypothetical protein CPB83DRAFT_892479 [Crepidotus variabilis]|uniref:Uncharacterized protein n=1 Tax=Crepidotus variabilis TaxID=179855 RepID=A0A9P6JRR2_9AGAR|nr:hypothetical protein CPB83DRAFT_892479 [Crepidotus variabilis]